MLKTVIGTREPTGGYDQPSGCG